MNLIYEHKYDNIKDFLDDIVTDASAGDITAALLTTTLLAAFLADMVHTESMEA